MLRKLIVFALILCVAMPTLAQVEFQMDIASFDAVEDAPVTGYGLSKSDQLFLSDSFGYLSLLGQEDEFCSGDIGQSEDPKYSVRVCVFGDPEEESQLLYSDASVWEVPAIIAFHNGQIVGVLSVSSGTLVWAAGIPELAPGEYELLVFSRGLELLSKVTFAISDPAKSVFFQTEFFNRDDYNKTHHLSNEHAMIARYLFQTGSDTFCSGDIPPYGTIQHTKVCVFEDPTTGAKILYANEAEESGPLYSSSSGNYRFTKLIVLHESEIVGVIGGGSAHGISDLTPGEYEVIVYYHYGVGSRRFPFYRFGSVSFTIPEPEEVSE